MRYVFDEIKYYSIVHSTSLWRISSMTSRETPDRMSFLLASQNVRCHMFGVVRTGDLYGADAQCCAALRAPRRHHHSAHGKHCMQLMMAEGASATHTHSLLILSLSLSMRAHSIIHRTTARRISSVHCKSTEKLMVFFLHAS